MSAILKKPVATDILEKHQKCQEAINEARKSAAVAVRLAWEIGNDLKEAKEQLSGKFTKWLEQELSGISTATAYRYMKLAELFPKEEELDERIKNNETLTEIYRNTGILPGSEASPKKITPVARFVKLVTQLNSRLESKASDLSPENWGTEEVTQFREILKKLNEFAESFAEPSEPESNLNTISEEVDSMEPSREGATA